MEGNLDCLWQLCVIQISFPSSLDSNTTWLSPQCQNDFYRQFVCLFQNWIEKSNFKNSEICNFQPFSAWGARNRTKVYSRTSNLECLAWPISQNTQVKEYFLYMIWNHSVLQNGELAFSNGQNSISRYFFRFFSHNPKFRFILFQYTNVYLCAKCGDLKPMIDEKQCPQIWTCFWARYTGAVTTFHKETVIFFWPNVS